MPKDHRRGKLSNVAWEGTLAGHSTQSPEWAILDPRTGNLRKAYSVTFDETMNTCARGRDFGSLIVKMVDSACSTTKNCFPTKNCIRIDLVSIARFVLSGTGTMCCRGLVCWLGGP